MLLHLIKNLRELSPEIEVWESRWPTKVHVIHTHTHTQPFYGSMDFVWDNPDGPVPEETFTHSSRGNIY